MALRVLIVSPDAGFGGLIQQTLDNSGEYEPVLVVNGRQALELASKLPFDLAILDADMTGFDMVELGMALQVLSPKVCLILIPGSSSTDDLTQSGLRICGFLTKPFYLPDLLEVVGKASHSGLDEGPLGATTTSILAAQDTQNVRIPVATEELSPQLAESPAWLGNPDRAAQHLARLSMASASQAALILRMGRLWAYAGHLSQAAAQELAEIIQHDWQRQLTRSVPETKISDLVRFVRLRSTGEDTMLYATSLGEQLVLVLAFDVRTPISRFHSQAGELARALAASSEAELPLGQAVIPASAGEEPGRAPKPDQHPEPAKTPSKSAPSPGMPKSEVTAPAKQEAAMPSPPLRNKIRRQFPRCLSAMSLHPPRLNTRVNYPGLRPCTGPGNSIRNWMIKARLEKTSRQGAALKCQVQRAQPPVWSRARRRRRSGRTGENISGRLEQAGKPIIFLTHYQRSCTRFQR